MIETMPAPPPADALTDEALVARVVGGERALFEVLMRRNNARLYRAIRGVIRDESAVEDVMQQTYLLAFGRLAQFQRESKFSTWLVRIGLNEALQKLRRARRRTATGVLLSVEEETTMEQVPRLEPSPEEKASAQQVVRLVERVLEHLPEAYRVVLLLRQVEGMSTEETASALELSEDAVKQRLHRGKALLRRELEARTGEHLAEVFPFEARRCDRVVASVWAVLGPEGQDNPRP